MVLKQHLFKKSFGQNFLRKKSWATKLIEAAEITSEDVVVEIGAGQGIVTEILLSQAKKVISLEIDRELIPFLQTKFRDSQNFELLEQDILSWNFVKALPGEHYKVVGSLPYNISKKIITSFLKSDTPPQTMAFIIQKEVAKDYVSQPPTASFLSNSAHLYADLKYITTVPKNSFYPTPQVDGAIIKFFNIKSKYPEPEKFLKFIKAGFINPRKKVSSNLANLGLDKDRVEELLVKFGLTATARASELSLEQWGKTMKQCQQSSNASNENPII